MWSRLKSVYFVGVLLGLSFGSVTHASAAPACPLDVEKTWSDCVGVFQPKPTSAFSGDTYRGDFKNDVFHGQGSYFYANGDVFFGTYDEGRLHGPGIYLYGPDTGSFGDSFIGQFVNDQRSGHGAYFFADGDMFIGSFADGVRQGPGTYFFKDGSVEHGVWQNGKFVNALNAASSAKRDCPDSPSAYFDDCFGSFTFDGGDHYVGEFKDDDFHGFGTYTFADGDFYQGYFSNGKWNGLGIYIFGTQSGSMGDLQIGWYRDGAINGQGAYLFNADGEWAGDIFTGDHKDGEASGLGTYFYADGTKFIGQYKDDVRNGPGTLYFADGTQRGGTWKDGEILPAGNAGTDDDGAVAGGTPAPGIPGTDEVLSASSGSGFAVSDDGFVITNHHVIDSCQEVYIHQNGRKNLATVVTADPRNDLALLKADFTPRQVLPLADKRPELLQNIYVAGYPFGMGISSTIKVTKGIVSSLTGFGNNFSEVQIDAALQSGNSGGPIVDEAGNVVGVAVAKLDVRYALENFGSISENTNFGIKSSVVSSILDSQTVNAPAANNGMMSTTDLGRRLTKSTFYISCWMTLAQIEALKTSKVMFDDLQ